MYDRNRRVGLIRFKDSEGAFKLPVLAQDQKNMRRANILKSARRCAAVKDFRDLTIDDICDDAGISKGAFYGYFDSKNQLFVALVDEEAAEDDALLKKLARSTSGLNRLRIFVKTMLERGEDPGRVQLQADLWATAAHDSEVESVFQEAIGSRRKVLREWIQESVDGAELASLPANALASILLALSDGLLLHSALDPGAFRWSNVQKVMKLIFEGLSPPNKQVRH